MLLLCISLLILSWSYLFACFSFFKKNSYLRSVLLFALLYATHSHICEMGDYIK